MYITRIRIQNFRNIREAELNFDKRLNILVGHNAQGKTNLCEAISVCLGQSFRHVRFSQFIPADDPGAEVRIKLFFCDNTDRENVIDYTIRKNNLSITFNGIKMKEAAELYGVLKYVIFIPENLNLIKGSPDIRRDYLDNVAWMQTNVHLKKLSRYNKGLKQRNNILSNFAFNRDISELKDMLAPWNEILAAEGVNVTYGRLRYFSFLKKCASEIYSDLTNGSENLDMEYLSSVFKTESINFDDADKLYKFYMSELEKKLNGEIKLKYTLTGVHRDDVNFLINGLSARDYASQGQIRSAALALKLSEAEIIRKKNMTDPVIILDDILSELDGVRREYVLNHIENSQVFITCCNINDLSVLHGGKAWETENGTFSELDFK